MVVKCIAVLRGMNPLLGQGEGEGNPDNARATVVHMSQQWLSSAVWCCYCFLLRAWAHDVFLFARAYFIVFASGTHWCNSFKLSKATGDMPS